MATAVNKRQHAAVDEFKDSGWYEAEFDGGMLPSGMYYYRLTAGKYREVKKMMLLK